MTRLVQKFGGTSVAGAEHIAKVAKIIADSKRSGKDVVVVVSAMGQTTDELISLAEQVCDEPDERELDVLLSTGEVVSIALLSMALHKLGVRARSFTGPQAGILTDEAHNFARIKTVHPTRIETSLARGEVAVVAGFQGMTRSSEITTLGRGGSDTTAVALAAALKAECCDIYTDVDGVYTTDPRIWKDARRLVAISYEEMLELASLGAQVLNARSVELALKNGVPIRLRSTFAPNDTGTLVTRREMAPDYTICGIALDAKRALAKVEMDHNKPIDPEKIERFLTELAAAGIQRSDLDFKVTQDVLTEVTINCEVRLSKTIKEAAHEFLGDNAVLALNKEVSRISVVGAGLKPELSGPELNAALAEAGIEVMQVTSRELSASAIIPASRNNEAVGHLHERLCAPHKSSRPVVLPAVNNDCELYAFQGEVEIDGIVAEQTSPLYSYSDIVQTESGGSK